MRIATCAGAAGTGGPVGRGARSRSGRDAFDRHRDRCGGTSRAARAGPGWSSRGSPTGRLSRFSTGVPGERDARRRRSARSSFAVRASGFFTCLRLVGDHEPHSTVASAAAIAAHDAVAWRAPPRRTQRRPGADHRRGSGGPGAGANRCDLPLPVAQQRRRADDQGGPAGLRSSCRCRWSAMSWIVLPRPMSSARQPPRPSAHISASQATPRRWYGRSFASSPAGFGELAAEAPPVPRAGGQRGSPAHPRRRRAFPQSSSTVRVPASAPAARRRRAHDRFAVVTDRGAADRRRTATARVPGSTDVSLPPARRARPR